MKAIVLGAEKGKIIVRKVKFTEVLRKLMVKLNWTFIRKYRLYTTVRYLYSSRL